MGRNWQAIAMANALDQWRNTAQELKERLPVDVDEAFCAIEDLGTSLREHIGLNSTIYQEAVTLYNNTCDIFCRRNPQFGNEVRKI